MKKIVRYVDEDTLEIMEKIVEVKDDISESDKVDEVVNLFEQALSCNVEEFSEKYKVYKEAEKAFNGLYEPFKMNLIELHKKRSDLPKSIVIGDIKLTYVSPSVRNSIDSKKLKEEEPEIAKKYTKTTNVKATIRLGETF